MQFESFFIGVGATVLGTLLGVWLSPKLLYPMQKKLLDHQLKFNEKISNEQSELIKDLRHHLSAISNKLNLTNQELRQAKKKE